LLETHRFGIYIDLTKELDVGFGDDIECEEFSNVRNTFYIMM
jgi:hypothetical protein